MTHLQLLGEEHIDSVRAYLNEKPLLNLYARTLTQPEMFHWQLWWGYPKNELFLIGEDQEFESLVFHWPGRHTLPMSSDSTGHDRLAHALSGFNLGIVMGDRAISDKVVAANRGYKPVQCFNHQMMTCERANVLSPLVDIEQAQPSDLAEVVLKCVQMSLEDFGLDPRVDGEFDYMEHVRNRIESGRTWVSRQDGEIVFLAHVGYHTDDAAQLGGTWVRPDLRGKGFGSRAISRLVDIMLARWPVVVLEVNEANEAAVRCYEKIGFKRHAPLRFYTDRDDREEAIQVKPEKRVLHRREDDLEFDRY